MPSPFPGMDPWLETRWGDVHTKLCVYACDSLNQQLGLDCQATVDERVVLQTDEGGDRGVYPDVRVVRRPPPGSNGNGTVTSGGPATATLAPEAAARPIAVEIEPMEVRQGFVEIRDRGGRLLTVIEFVSPTNKRPGDGLEKYRRKQRECRENDVSLVEIDLTRGGRRELLAPAANLPDRAARAAYLASVYRPWQPSRADAWPMPLRSPLPVIPVPVREGVDEPTLDLRALVDRAYDGGRYGSFLDYAADLDPPLHPADGEWAEGVLRQASVAT